MSATKRISGYLVVLESPEPGPSGFNQANLLYRGPFNMPSYPSQWVEEAAAMDEFVFGPSKDDESNVIADLNTARELLARFSSSPRRFQIIYVSNCDESPPDEAHPVELGYDVTSFGGDFYSRVADFPNRDDFKLYSAELNQFGLFACPEDAANFLKAYCDAKLPEHDKPATILHVWRVT